ncbi:MEIKN protein, partial [Todus mexicanus]|nr:MEIKN protein [Todus mexicanus]
MTLPTGVSTFLLECLDVDSTVDYNTSTSGSLSSHSSPETFRFEGSEGSGFYPEDLDKYRNSTLLDSSKAVAIDKIPQISNLSAILGNSCLRHLNIRINRFTLNARNLSCGLLSQSELICWKFITGKKVCKITATQERTPDLKSGTRCSSSLGPERKPDNQTAKSKRLKLKKKGRKSTTLGEGASSVSQPDAPGTAAARSGGVTAEVLPSERTDAV